jgi:sialate O-acetylesterase
MAEWELKNVAIDSGNQGRAAGWPKPGFRDAEWKTMELPRQIESAGLEIDGAIWFRRAVEIPAAWAGKDLVLTLGAIDDFDTTYFEGREIGSTGRETPGYWTHPRRYTVPHRLVRQGRAVIAVRVFDRAGEGGFGGGAADMALGLASGGGSGPIPLAGPWRFAVERAVGPMKPDWGSQPVRPDEQGAPTTLWNAMVAPLTQAAIRGAIWYQGEANAGNATLYAVQLKAMIGEWRACWGGEFPFLSVQLPGFMKAQVKPVEEGWAGIRETFLKSLAAVPNTGMAVTIDIGEADNIHPKNKQDVGSRLAQWALAKTYGKPIVACGPLYKGMKKDGAAIVCEFDYTGGGLVAKDGEKLKGFAIAGADKAFVWAEARIEGQTVVVSSPEMKDPVAVRYAWANNPACNLYNKEGLPASPFRTDD